MNQLTRRELLTGAAAAAAAAHADTGTRRCNVIVVKSDEHNPLVSSVYGHPLARTPTMDRLARMGTVFESAYCPSPLCMPSRSAYVSGRFVHEIQAYSNCNVFEGGWPTYGRVLREQGVHTVHIGKADFDEATDKLGFSEMILPQDRKRPGDRMVSRHPLAIRTGDGRARGDGWSVRPDPHAHDSRCVDAAIAWLEKSSGVRQPWTLEVNVVAPHFPEYVTQAEWDLYTTGGDLPRYGRACASARHPIAEDLRRHFETDYFTDAQIRGLRRSYLGCVSYVDAQLGRVLDAATRLGLLHNTAIAYTSDHGEMLGKFGMWWKCSLYEDSARVPLIVAGPGFAKGRRVRTPVTQLDLQASLFRAVGAKRPSAWHGSPLQDVRSDDPNRVAFCEYHGHGTRCSSYVIRKGRWKLIYHAEAPHQLFDLQADPNELHDLADRSREVLHDLTAELRRICDPDAENRRAAEYIRRQLAAMGMG